LTACATGDGTGDDDIDVEQVLEDLTDNLEGSGDGGGLDWDSSGSECEDLHIGESCEMRAGYAENVLNPVDVEVTLVSVVERAMTDDDPQVSCDTASFDPPPVFDVELKIKNLTDYDTAGLEWTVGVTFETAAEEEYTSYDHPWVPLTFGPGDTQSIRTPHPECPPYDGAKIQVSFTNSGATGTATWIDIIGDRG
jgi:hypothetical protein